MPGFDRTGPRGEGSRTGGGRGYCGTPTRNSGKKIWPSGRFGGGRQRGWRNRYYATGIPGWAWWHGQEASRPPLTSREEIELLQDEAKCLENELKDINKNISALREEKSKKEKQKE